MLTTILIFALILFVLVIVHEVGHFVAAKLMGIRVDEFGFGLPPRALGKKIGETIYSLNWLPIGGFVKLYGEDEQHPEYVKSQKNRAFFSKKPWQRAIVLVAGVTMNFLLAWLIFSYLFTAGLDLPTGEVQVGEVLSNSPAEQIGIEVGDIVRKIIIQENGVQKTVEITIPDTLVQTIDTHRGENVTVIVERNSKEVELPAKLRTREESEQGLGISFSPVIKHQQYPLLQSFSVAFFFILSLIQQLLAGISGLLGRALTFHNVSKEVSGPLGIGVLVNETKQYGINALLYLTAFLSINLAVINIAPFPALDGGRLLFVVIEALTGRKVNQRWEQILHQAGMIILLFLLFLISINDVVKFINGQI